MSFFLPRRPQSASSASPALLSRSRLLRPTLSVLAMASVIGVTAWPAVTANAATVAVASADAAGELAPANRVSGDATPQTVEAGGAGQMTVALDEYLAEAPAPPPPAPVAPAAPSAAASVGGGGGAVVWPVPLGTRVSDGFGPRSAPCSGCSTFHDGLDMNPGAGTPVGSIAAGVVVVASNDSGGLGTHVEIEHVVDGVTITSSYGHMQYGSMTVSVGESVGAGQLIGLVGSTGQSTGPHLHLELFYGDGVRIDPAAWLNSYAG